MSTQLLTALNPMPPVTCRVRAYFAPVDRVNQRAAIFDPSINGQFSLSAPPAPWVDLGWIEDFSRKSLSKITAVTTGSPAVTQFQAKHSVDATVSFRFKTWSKLSMALSAGSQHMNLLAPGAGASVNGSGAKAAPAVNLAGTGSTATFLALNPGTSPGFTTGCIIAVDADYVGQTGFVGSGVYAAYVQSSSAVNGDPDYIRRVTFNVARVSQVTSAGLQLAQPLVAGVPTSTMRVQQALGFVDREGGNFFQEWSGLFVMQGEQGERILFHYPRLQATTGPEETATALVGPIERIALSASFRALPVTDANDGQQAVCFRSFLPSAMTLI
ncbi:MAG: hypothetical protein JOZ33_13485 [Acidobacteriaceae bacterium]|nr:hypothetical protein [Acidobacteriaceae bacterium]